MSLSKINNLHDLNLEIIKDKILILQKEIITLKIEKAIQKNTKTHILKFKKHQLAQLLTIEHIKLKQENAT